jgi:hypothetical protein
MTNGKENMNRFWIVAVSLCVLTTSCGRKSLPQSELHHARESIEAALGVWKKGGTPDELVKQGIEAEDPDWSAGAILKDFLIYDAEGQKRENIRCGAILTLIDRQGATVNREVFYTISGTDRLHIKREGN